MKKIYRLLLFLALTFSGVKVMEAQSFNGGLIAGATFCQVDGDHYAGYHQLGFTAGAYVNFPVEDHLLFQMEMKYSLLGAHSSDKEVTEYYYTPYNHRLHYAELPLMLRYDLGYFQVNGKALDFITVEAGVSLDFRLKATEDVDGDYQVTTSRWNFFSMTGNAGLHFAFNDHWGMGARFMYSVVPIRFTGNPGWFYGQYYNKVIQFTLTYNINSPVR
jgi:opacity protein-like surface antigen